MTLSQRDRSQVPGHTSFPLHRAVPFAKIKDTPNMNRGPLTTLKTERRAKSPGCCPAEVDA